MSDSTSKRKGYSELEDFQNGFKVLNNDEKKIFSSLNEEASLLIDAVNKNADEDVKRIVSNRIIRRAIANYNQDDTPIGATQGSMSANGYSQSWTLSNGAVSEIYLSKTEKKMLGGASNIGTYSPIESAVEQ